MPTPTDQQLAIIAAAEDQRQHIIVQARAGTGKTTTLLQLLSKLKGSTSLQAFNKSIAQELTSRIDALDMATRLSLPGVLDISTVHAAGLRTYKRHVAAATGSKGPTIQGGKLNFIQKDMFKTNDSDREYFAKVGSTLTRIVSAAKSAGFDLTSTSESFPTSDIASSWLALLAHFGWDIELEQASISIPRTIAHCQKLLRLSVNNSAMLDFDDMIYMPLLLNHRFPTYSHVLIDEAQDISATRRELAFRMLDPRGSRIIAVGDEFQAIYGFTGADAASISNIAHRAASLGSVTTLPLTTCWRCDADIIVAAQRFVPDITARPQAPAGKVTSISAAKMFETINTYTPASAPLDPDLLLRLPNEGDAILCRLNKPNVAVALDLLRAGKRARIEGRDIGQKLLSHVRQAEPTYNFASLTDLIIATEAHGARASAVLAARDRHMQADMLLDEIDCAILLMERCIEAGDTDYSDLEVMVNSLFGDDVSAATVITLSSIHKAKGREWSRVFLLGRYDFQPFHRATADWELQQENNLIYVAITRAETQLTYITDVQSWLDTRRPS